MAQAAFAMAASMPIVLMIMFAIPLDISFAVQTRRQLPDLLRLHRRAFLLCGSCGVPLPHQGFRSHWADLLC